MNMHKGDPRGVFFDLFDEAEAMEMEICSKIYQAVTTHIEAKGYRQKEVAKLLGIHQPDASDLLSGKIGKFSLGRLVIFAGRLGLRLDVRVAGPKAKPKAAARPTSKQRAA